MSLAILPPESPFFTGLMQTAIKHGANPVQLRLRNAHIPPSFRKVRFDRLEPREGAALAACQALAAGERVRGKRGLLLTGRPGNGKTTLAVATLRAWVERTGGQSPARFWGASEGLAEVRASFGKDGPEPPPLATLAHYNDLLVIDDLGQQKITEWVAEQFYLLLNALTTYDRAVVITTNREDMLDYLSEASISRLLGLCHPITLTGSDRRLEEV